MPLLRAFCILFVLSRTLLSQSFPLQPLALQIRRIDDALAFIGQPLPGSLREELDAAIALKDEAAAIRRIEAALDPYTLAIVEINPEARVKVLRGPAPAKLLQGSSTAFLVKVVNQAHLTAPLNVSSLNAAKPFEAVQWNLAPTKAITTDDIRQRWADIQIYRKAPLSDRLTGFDLEYQVVEIASRDSGARAAAISFDVGQGTQDIGFRNDISVLFDAKPARKIRLNVRDENGQPTMASLTIRDPRNQLYPSPSRRLAPDLFFQPQIYRADGETVSLPQGHYTLVSSGGPEYHPSTQEFVVDDKGPAEVSIRLNRWIDPSNFGWHSGDSHIHAAGCSHYRKPEEGVRPQDMIRQIQGEKLAVASVLNWGPGYYHQKQFFSSKDDALSTDKALMHYDLEVSGFPSSDSGHLALLGLREQDYPGTKRLEDWPSWNLPILKWAKSQGAVVGYTHSGWGLQVSDKRVPSFQLPGFDGIGANEYIVDVTHPDTVDFLSVGDTPYVWEMSIWYHALNTGFRTRIAGETDFPCITDERIGLSRSYVQVDGPLTYRKWVDGLKTGRGYLSDGRAHLMDFRVNDTRMGVGGSELKLERPGKVKVSFRAAAMLDKKPHPEIQDRPYAEKPYWTIERARIGQTNEVPVELIVNGDAVAVRNLVADGVVREMSFEVDLPASAWVAVRILPAAHTNPIFVTVGGKPVRSRASAEWCLRGVQQCWTQKLRRISPAERPAARAAYDHAEEVYRKLMAEGGR